MSTPSDSAPGDWRAWIGRSEQRSDVLTAAAAAAFAATLDRDASTSGTRVRLPLLGHWLLFSPWAHSSALGPDGHPRRGEFLPPVTLPRRMWAGSRIEFQRDLYVGETLSRLSRITAVELKSGRGGELVFVTVRHEVSDADGLALVEEQDIVYREAPRGGAAPAAHSPAPPAAFERRIVPGPVLLFRYSALTGNAHRIHYDQPYATGVEGYQGLVVHGPLTATLLLDLLQRQYPGATVRTFNFRALRPLFANEAFTVCGREQDARAVALWASTPDGQLAMQAHATLGPA